MHTLCYFCQTSDRTQFLSQLENNTCPYFWRHDKEYCRDLPNDIGENYLQYNFLSEKISEYYDKIAPSLKLNLSSVADLINLTAIRSARNDHIGERERGEYLYMCYCPSTRRWGIQCDIYTNVLIPLQREALYYIGFAMKSVFAIAFLLMVVIPKNIACVKSRKSVSRLKAILQGLFTQLDAVAASIAFTSILASMMVDLLHFTESAVGHFFTSVSYVLLGIATLLLIVQWSHIYDSASELIIDGELSRKNRTLLIVILVTIITLLVIALVGNFITFFVPLSIRNKYDSYLNGTMYAIACTFLGGFAISFLIYGLLMFSILRKVDSKLSILQLRVTRMMLYVIGTFIHFMLWLMLVTIHHFAPVILGRFLDLFLDFICTISMFCSITAIGALLFSPLEFRQAYWFLDVWVNKCFEKRKGYYRNLSTAGQELLIN
jgi:hypothetical protein